MPPSKRADWLGGKAARYTLDLTPAGTSTILAELTVPSAVLRPATVLLVSFDVPEHRPVEHIIDAGVALCVIT